MKITKSPFLHCAIFLLLFAGCAKNDPPVVPPVEAPSTVVFNEIMTTGNPDWIELYNYGTEDVDMEGYMVYDQEVNRYALPAGHVLKPGAFLILYCDDQGVDLNLPFKLTSQGESITLERADGKMIDHVVFPAMDNQQTYARYPDGNTGTWQITGFATQNMTNGSGPVSSFKSYSYSPDIPLVGGDINFSLELSDGTNVAKVEVFYAVDGNAFQAVTMTSSDNINYNGSVPALTAEGELYYYFKLTDTQSNEVMLPGNAPDKTYHLTLTSGQVPNLIINEFMASNATTIADPDSVGEYEDWIEIYNAGTTEVDMGRFYFSDSENPFDDRIPGDMPQKTTIQPGGYLLFWADSDTGQGPNHLKFKLSANGESISLYYKDGRLIDSHSFGLQTTDISEGRSPDGSDNWVKFTTPTPGTANP